MILAMISTDDSRIFSATITISQDVILPFIKKQMTPQQHMWLLRGVAIAIGVFFYLGSSYMAQLDYINLFVTITISMWTGGCAPVMIFGLYSRFGTTIAAWTSLLTGMVLSLVAIVIDRNWADIIYPFLERRGWTESIGSVLEKISAPLPWIEWHMNAQRCPINGYEFSFFITILTLVLYIVVSYLTCKEPFNLDRMLHRGKYNLDGENKDTEKLSLKNALRKILGITPEYTTGDKAIAWAFFVYSFIYQFIIIFLVVLVWNIVTPWPVEWWSKYFFIVQLLIPGILAFITTFWYGIGGIKDLIQLFRDLEKRKINHLDNGMVDGNMSLADKTELEAIDAKREQNK